MLMHVLKLKNNNDYIVLRIEGYEFENFKDNIEWLMLYGKVASGKRKVEGEEITNDPASFIVSDAGLAIITGYSPSNGALIDA